MRLFRILAFIVLLSSIYTHSSAQIDSFSATELIDYERNFHLSAPGYVRHLDSCTLLKDTACASGILMRIDPLYLLAINEPSNIDSFLRKHAISQHARDAYAQLYRQAKNAPKTDTWTQFKSMAEEDQKVRWLLEKCGDSITCGKLEKRMIRSDSTHAAYLLSYVKKHGWPDIANGSHFASLLAIHDHNNHAFYLPHLKKAVISGQANKSAFDLISYHYNHKAILNEFLTNIAKKQKYTFDVSSLLVQVMPSNITQMQNAVREACGKIYLRIYIFQAADKKTYTEWVAKSNPRKLFQNINNELQPFCKSLGIHTWQLNYLPGEKTKLTYYILYK